MEPEVKLRIAIVAGLFHTDHIDIMLAAAKAAAAEYNVDVTDIVRVPGSYEKPLAVKRLLQRSTVDAVVVLGIIERGETAHGRVMGQTVSDALVRLQLEFMKPVGIGILGPEIEPVQFASRREKYAADAVAAVVAMQKLS
nr:6,7-dimethyl-8-ribityllumazine synthase [uncultured Rhodopila sp.]